MSEKGPSGSPRQRNASVPTIADIPLKSKHLAGPGASPGPASWHLQIRHLLVVVVVAAVSFASAFFAGPFLAPSLFEGDVMRQLLSCRAQVALITADGASTVAGEVEKEIGSKAEGQVQGEKRRVLDVEEKLSREVNKLKKMLRKLKIDNKGLRVQLAAVQDGNAATSNVVQQSMKEAVGAARQMLDGCNAVRPAFSKENGELTIWKGYECNATDEDMKRYLNYKPGGMCPNDWYFVQRLIFRKNCFVLPRRRCISVTPARPIEPLPRPDSYFSQDALKDENVRWDLHQCKSFECLNTRTKGDCRNCFNMTLEAHRWKSTYRGGLPMEQVLAFKPGSIRIGLDVGGGTGSFAARMATHGVTVMTTAFNVETVVGAKAGLPYMETIAMRGLIPLHWPHKARLPLYDGVLDIIHSVNSIKYLEPVEFQELIYEWNRVLRTGGLLWFEMFYAPTTVMPTYVAIIEHLGYNKLYWNFTPKPESGERKGPHVYLNCLLEKRPSPGKELLSGPLPEDMDHIV